MAMRREKTSSPLSPLIPTVLIRAMIPESQDEHADAEQSPYFFEELIRKYHQHG